MYTADRPGSWAEAVAVRTGRILMVGGNEEVLRTYPDAVRIDLGGRTMLPGFIDSHNHYLLTGESLASIDAVWARLPTDQRASTVFIGGSFTLMALPLVVLSVGFGRLVDRKSSRLVATFGILAVAPAVAAYGWLSLPVALGAAGILHAIGGSAISPAAAALVAEGSPPDMIARGQASSEAVGFLGAAAAAFPTGWAYESLGRATWFTFLSGVGVVLFTIGWRLSHRPYGSRPDPAALREIPT